MSSNNSNDTLEEFINEDEIYKSLSHKVRRDIVIAVGSRKFATFSEIQKEIGNIDSPTLSYHLKQIKALVYQDNKVYKITEIGNAALNLLMKTDQSKRISRYKQKFLYAYFVTVCCWISALFIIPIVFIFIQNDNLKLGLIQFIVTIISWINFIIVWILRKRY